MIKSNTIKQKSTRDKNKSMDVIYNKVTSNTSKIADKVVNNIIDSVKDIINDKIDTIKGNPELITNIIMGGSKDTADNLNEIASEIKEDIKDNIIGLNKNIDIIVNGIVETYPDPVDQIKEFERATTKIRDKYVTLINNIRAHYETLINNKTKVNVENILQYKDIVKSTEVLLESMTSELALVELEIIQHRATLTNNLSIIKSINTNETIPVDIYTRISNAFRAPFIWMANMIVRCEYTITLVSGILIIIIYFIKDILITVIANNKSVLTNIANHDYFMATLQIVLPAILLMTDIANTYYLYMYAIGRNDKFSLVQLMRSALPSGTSRNGYYSRPTYTSSKYPNNVPSGFTDTSNYPNNVPSGFTDTSNYTNNVPSGFTDTSNYTNNVPSGFTDTSNYPNNVPSGFTNKSKYRI
jgi:hypothetical protein